MKLRGHQKTEMSSLKTMTKLINIILTEVIRIKNEGRT